MKALRLREGILGGLVAHVMYGLVLGWWLVWRAAPLATRAGA
ncbi:MAG: hypothetical protein AAB295_08010 [Chloroflexota bacterium]